MLYKTVLFIAYFFFFSNSFASKTLTTFSNTNDSIPKNKAQLISKYGNSDTAKMIIEFMWRKRERKQVASGIISGIGVGFGVASATQQKTANPNIYTGLAQFGMNVLAMLAGITASFIAIGIPAKYSKRKIIKTLHYYNVYHELPNWLKHNSAFKSFCKFTYPKLIK